MQISLKLNIEDTNKATLSPKLNTKMVNTDLRKIQQSFTVSWDAILNPYLHSASKNAPILQTNFEKKYKLNRINKNFDENDLLQRFPQHAHKSELNFQVWQFPAT